MAESIALVVIYLWIGLIVASTIGRDEYKHIKRGFMVGMTAIEHFLAHLFVWPWTLTCLYVLTPLFGAVGRGIEKLYSD